MPTAALAAGDAEKGRAAWEYTCQHCHGTPQPGSNAAFSDYGPTANPLSVYAGNAAAITKAATLGYTIPQGNTNDKEAPGGSTNHPMGTWAGMAPNRLGLGATPTQYALDFSAYFATFFAAPGAPVIASVTPGSAQASVSFSAPRSELAITGYTVTANPGAISATGTASPIAVSGLASGTLYTFTVSATSNAGTGKPSAVSAQVVAGAASQAGVSAAIPKAVVPAPALLPAPAAVATAPAQSADVAAGAPYIKFVRAGNAQVRVYFEQPPGAPPAASYTVTAYAGGKPAGISATGPKSPVAVTGLANGTDYTFTVTAGSGKAALTSAPSGVATPLRLLGD